MKLDLLNALETKNALEWSCSWSVTEALKITWKGEHFFIVASFPSATLLKMPYTKENLKEFLQHFDTFLKDLSKITNIFYLQISIEKGVLEIFAKFQELSSFLKF